MMLTAWKRMPWCNVPSCVSGPNAASSGDKLRLHNSIVLLHWSTCWIRRERFKFGQTQALVTDCVATDCTDPPAAGFGEKSTCSDWRTWRLRWRTSTWTDQKFQVSDGAKKMCEMNSVGKREWTKRSTSFFYRNVDKSLGSMRVRRRDRAGRIRAVTRWFPWFHAKATLEGKGHLVLESEIINPRNRRKATWLGLENSSCYSSLRMEPWPMVSGYRMMIVPQPY